MMEMSIKTDQIKILEDFFQDLSNVNQRRVFIASFRRAAKPLVNAAKTGAPKKTGRLMRSFGTMDIPNEVAILVGSRLSGSNKCWYGHLIEGGTKEREFTARTSMIHPLYRGTSLNGFFTTRQGQSYRTGKMTANPFFERAYNATESQIYDTIEDEWLKEIDRFIIRTNRKLK